MYKIFKIFLSMVVIAVCVYVSWTPVHNIYTDLVAQYFPCEQPITYTFGEFDSEFGISQADFLKDVVAAQDVWQKALGRQLFTYEASNTNADLKINLIFDYRQQATVSMQQLGTSLDTTQASYDALKAQYDSMRADYVRKKAAFDATVALYQKDRAALNAEINDANTRGGASGQTYSEFVAQEKTMNDRATAIQTTQAALNTEVASINGLVTTLNQSASALNLTVDKFNQIGQSTGEEFNEALYIQDQTGNHIDVFQYSNNEKLVRVLAHELGHALGMEHVADSNAIMYKINQSTSMVPTPDDVAELKRVCKVK